VYISRSRFRFSKTGSRFWRCTV